MKTKTVPLVVLPEHIKGADRSASHACVMARAIQDQLGVEFERTGMAGVRSQRIDWPDGSSTMHSIQVENAIRNFDSCGGFEPGIYPIKVPASLASK